MDIDWDYEYEHFSIWDGDDMIEYGENVIISMDLKNVGSELTEDVEVSLSIDDEYISLDDYVNNMKEGQEKIYFITGQNKQSLLSIDIWAIFLSTVIPG